MKTNQKILIGVGILTIIGIVLISGCLEKKQETGKITKKQAIEIASETEEVKEFLKLYPDANLEVKGYCCYGSVFKYDEDCKLCKSPLEGNERPWGVKYWKDEISVGVAIEPKSGEIRDLYPKLEYIKNATYCERDKDCSGLRQCPGTYHIPCMTGCANIYHKEKIEKETICIQCVACQPCDTPVLFCKCINNTCTATEKPK